MVNSAKIPPAIPHKMAIINSDTLIFTLFYYLTNPPSNLPNHTCRTCMEISLQGHLFPPPPAHASTAEDYPRNLFLPNRNRLLLSGFFSMLMSEVFIRFFLFDSLRGKDRKKINTGLLLTAWNTATA